MSSNMPTTPQGNVQAIGIPNSQDYARLIYAAPYFTEIAIAEIIEPSVLEAVEAVLPSLVPQYVDAAAQAAVQAQAVLLVGSTMTGPLFLNPVMPSADAQAASKAYVDTMLATAGIPEVPPVPVGQVWARETGQWVPISQTGGTFLPIAGGSMQGNINMSGNTITNMAAVPAMPNGAAPAQWVLNQIASVSLYQGTWDADTNVPDLTQLSTHVNAYTWIALTTNPAGVVIGAAIPGLQGTTVFNGDTIIYSTVQGGFKAIHSGGITLPEADGRYVQLAGSQMSGPLLLNANATQPLQATTFQQLEAAVANTVTPDAPADGQAYLRVGVGTNRWVPGLPLAGGILTGALTLSGNATQPLNAVPLQQVNSLITAGTTGFLPLAGGQMTGLMQLSGNATANLNPVPLQQLNSMLGTYAPIQNPVFTGSVTLPGNAASALQAVPFQQLTSYVGSQGFATTAQLAGYVQLQASPGTPQAGTLNSLNVAGNVIAGTTVQTPTVIVANGVNFGSPTPNFAIGVNGPGTVMNVGSIAGHNMLIQTAANPVFEWTIPGPTAIMTLTSGGALTVASLTQTSDETTKNGIAAYTPGVSIAAQLLPKTFIFNGDPDNATHLGFIAQDVRPVLPDAVTSSQMGESTLLGLDITAIVAVLANAVKQLISRVQALESNANITPSAAETA